MIWNTCHPFDVPVFVSTVSPSLEKLFALFSISSMFDLKSSFKPNGNHTTNRHVDNDRNALEMILYFLPEMLEIKGNYDA